MMVRRHFPARCALAAGAAASAMLSAARPALAHGGATGAQDVLQDYGVLIFLVAVVLIGAGVLAWVTLSPPPEPATPEPAPGDADAKWGSGGVAPRKKPSS